MLSLLSFRVIFTALITTLLFGPLVYLLSRRVGLVDVPLSAPHKRHASHIPIAGGITLALALYVLAWAHDLIASPEASAILTSAWLIFFFGLWDDRRALPVYLKLLGQLAATLLLIRQGVQIRIFLNNWVNYSLTILWVVGITNAFNFVDSMDGLAVGLAVLASAFFMLVTFDAGQIRLSLLSAILLGAGLGCFYYNTSPARFFLGDSGSQLIGFVLAALAIAYNPPGFEQLASWYVPILLMGVPLFDITLVVISRLRHQKPIYKAARDHTYHRLVALGMSSNRAVLTMHTVALLLGCLAFIALGLDPLVANLIFFSTLLAGTGMIVFLEWQAG